MCEGTPETRCFAFGANMLQHLVGEGAIAFVVAVVFVGADMDDVVTEDSFIEVFIKDGGDEGEGFGIGEVEHRGAFAVVLIAHRALVHEVRADAHHGEGMTGDVKFRDDFYATLVGIGFQIAIVLLGVGDVGGGETRNFGLQAEGTSGGLKREHVLRGLDAWVVVQPNIVVREVKLEFIEFVVGADVNQLAQRREREGLTAAVKHEATHGIVRPVFGDTAGEGAVLCVEDLHYRARAPIGGEGRMTHNGDIVGGDFNRVTFGIFLFRLGLERRLATRTAQDDVALCRLLCEEVPPIGIQLYASARDAELCGEGGGVLCQGVASCFGNHNASRCTAGVASRAIGPLLEFWNHFGFGTPCGGTRQHCKG